MKIKDLQKQIVFSIDVGSEVCGVSVIRDMDIIAAFNVENSLLWNKLRDFSTNQNLVAVIEDIRPYSKKLSKDVINTCKFIGEMTYRMKVEYGIEYTLISRSEVRNWIFNRYNDECVAKIEKRIEYLDDYGQKKGGKRYRTKTGELRKPSFHFVDDRIIISTMKKAWDIPTPKPGKSNMYGLSKHSWQALALATYFIEHQEKLSVAEPL